MSNAEVVEEVVTFSCDQARLWGVLSRPAPSVATADTAVLIVVGGPQYRVGSHRQFVLLARAFAAAGHPTLRFDYTGMGDSEGSLRTFDTTAADLHAALDTLAGACPASPRIVVWGLCDAASAALMFASGDPRVAGIVAANPWARSEATLAATRLKHYYVTRLLQRDFWAKLLRGGLRWSDSWRALRGSLANAVARAPANSAGTQKIDFQVAMARGLARLHGEVLLILSGNDLTAREFIEYTRSSSAWRGLLQQPKVTRIELAEADHTFSQRHWLDRVIAESIAWLQRLNLSQAASRPAP
jgi:exosortase A-associated hydrolase 1